MKLWLIHLLDKIDNIIFRHRFYWFCQKVNLSSWWGEEDCPCAYCSKYRDKWEKLDKEINNEQS